MSENSPAMTSPLVNHLHFDGITEYGNEPQRSRTWIIIPKDTSES